MATSADFGGGDLAGVNRVAITVLVVLGILLVGGAVYFVGCAMQFK